MQGIVWILFFYLLGCVVSALTGNFVPGSVVGMLLLFGALSLGWLRPWRMKRAAGFLLDNMMLFFIPVGVGLIASYSLVSKYLTAILVASIVSTVLVIVVVGMIEQKLEGKRRDVTGTDVSGSISSGGTGSGNTPPGGTEAPATISPATINPGRISPGGTVPGGGPTANAAPGESAAARSAETATPSNPGPHE